MMQLSQREKIAVRIAAICLLLFVGLQFMVFPFLDNRARLTQSLAERERSLLEMRLMQQRYGELNQQSDSLAAVLLQRDQGFSLFSFLEKNATDSEVKEHVAYMRPSQSAANELYQQSMIEMRLQAVSLGQLVRFLERTESPEQLVGVDRITIQENTQEDATLDVTLRVVSIDHVAGIESR
ncbi:type II secretion system protein M [Desulfobulbus alkaliphilus]|uniref:type II secretion system protein M n=1 Tax=Desulfobulbus alkaliphilus TaxID=869814 RepID=UPI0019630BBE|nr:type II secretion system protein M [Desulfobulbus alkaliphilus]MBM9536050.1 type II secretion system protein M [Desulfobulbus alkaliphilus]